MLGKDKNRDIYNVMEAYGHTPYDSLFPKELNHSELGCLKRLNVSKDVFNKINKLLDAGRLVYFATWWSKEYLKVYGYDDYFSVQSPKAGFESNLDLASIVIACESIDRLYAMSVYTEALYRFDSEDFEPINFNNPICGCENIYLNGTMPFAVYVEKEITAKNINRMRTKEPDLAPELVAIYKKVISEVEEMTDEDIADLLMENGIFRHSLINALVEAVNDGVIESKVISEVEDMADEDITDLLIENGIFRHSLIDALVEAVNNGDIGFEEDEEPDEESR